MTIAEAGQRVSELVQGKQPLTQAEHEHECAQAGYSRTLGRIQNNEERGRVDNNPYMNPVLRRWLGPITEAVEQELASTGKPGRRGAHVKLLRPLEAQSVAYFAIRVALLTTVSHVRYHARDIGRQIGQVLFQELVLSQFEHLKPELFWDVSHDLDRRRSKDLRHRYTALRHTAVAAEVPLPAWTAEDREQVGLALVELLRVAGFLDIRLDSKVVAGRRKTQYVAELAQEVRELVQSSSEATALALPMHQPCIEPPKDWPGLAGGGYHTDRLRRTLPRCVNLRRGTAALRQAVAAADLSKVVAAINHLQRVPWQVNRELYEALQVVGKRMSLDEIVAEDIGEGPPPPTWLTPDMTREAMTEEQQRVFRDWKGERRMWYEQRKLNGQRWGRMVSALGMAQKYGPARNYAPLYFVYQADFRGRLYALSMGISPQGSDLQKALLRFHEGKPLDTPDAVRWFKIGGTSKFGFDKASFEDRVRWVDERREHIIDCAENPTNGGLWLDADKPLQFLAWCQEYARWQREGDAFLSHLPIGFDGSCNGLQHFSAMLRDEVGGKAVNLVDSPLPNDIYSQVAAVTTGALEAADPAALDEAQQRYRAAWLAHGVNRKLVKRSVMTLPYGSTRFSSADFILEDYLKRVGVDGLEAGDYRGAAGYLSHRVWAAIGQVVVAARSAMDWLQACATKIIASGGQIGWTTPSGFPVVQHYDEIEETRVRSLLLGGTVKIRIGRPADGVPCPRQHKNGIAPNFVHSMDAAALVLTTLACEEAGITSLAMIHDDYGTHAADAQRLYELIRQTFVRMYEQHDPIAAFAAEYSDLPPPPAQGSLDLRQVLGSRFFFA